MHSAEHLCARPGVLEVEIELRRLASGCELRLLFLQGKLGLFAALRGRQNRGFIGQQLPILEPLRNSSSGDQQAKESCNRKFPGSGPPLKAAVAIMLREKIDVLHASSSRSARPVATSHWPRREALGSVGKAR